MLRTPPAGLRDLLDAAFAGRFTDDDWDHGLGGHHVVVTDDDALVAHAAVVLRPLSAGDRSLQAGYVEAVATAPARQGEQLGSLAMAEVARILHREFDLGALSTSSHGFYERLGWERWLGPTYVRRRGGEVVRTADEDAGIMVLRVGRSSDLDLTSSLTCDERDGDDW